MSILSQAEQDFLVATFGTCCFWIGFTDEAEEGVWRWTTGEPVTYWGFRPGEPNNVPHPEEGVDEDYAAIWEPDGRWIDVYGGNTGIVEYGQPIPEPGTYLLFGGGLLGLAVRRLLRAG